MSEEKERELRTETHGGIRCPLCGYSLKKVQGIYRTPEFIGSIIYSCEKEHSWIDVELDGQIYLIRLYQWI